MKRINIEISDRAYDILKKIGIKERRKPGTQAAIILEYAIEKEQNKEGSNKCELKHMETCQNVGCMTPTKKYLNEKKPEPLAAAMLEKILEKEWKEK